MTAAIVLTGRFQSIKRPAWHAQAPFQSSGLKTPPSLSALAPWCSPGQKSVLGTQWPEKWNLFENKHDCKNYRFL